MFPHEPATLWINLLFVVVEFVVGLVVMFRFMKTQKAAFFLRTAPIIDRKFRKRYAAGAQDIMSAREVQLGMQGYNRERDTFKPFKNSDKFNDTIHVA